MKRSALGGLWVRKERWGLSAGGKALVLVALAGACLALAKGMYPFLAVTDRTSGELMVVEGWIQGRSIEQAAREWRASNYRDVVVVCAVHSEGNTWESGRHRAEYIVESLVQRGVPKERVHAVFCDIARRDRTYGMALAVKDWIREQELAVGAMDVVTLGPHARRSRLLFRKAFGGDVRIGVIALDEWSYDPAHWWRSSDGVREVLFEGLAYAYARLFFGLPGRGTGP